MREVLPYQDTAEGEYHIKTFEEWTIFYTTLAEVVLYEDLADGGDHIKTVFDRVTSQEAYSILYTLGIRILSLCR